jgi:hypothetical protein
VVLSIAVIALDLTPVVNVALGVAGCSIGKPEVDLAFPELILGSGEERVVKFLKTTTKFIVVILIIRRTCTIKMSGHVVKGLLCVIDGRGSGALVSLRCLTSKLIQSETRQE